MMKELATCGRCGHTGHYGSDATNLVCYDVRCDCPQWVPDVCPGSEGKAGAKDCPGREEVGGHASDCPAASN
jgi:hypothetical protein